MLTHRAYVAASGYAGALNAICGRLRKTLLYDQIKRIAEPALLGAQTIPHPAFWTQD